MHTVGCFLEHVVDNWFRACVEVKIVWNSSYVLHIFMLWCKAAASGGWGTQNSRQLAPVCGMAVSPMHWPPLPPGNIPWYSFLLEAESIPGSSVAHSDPIMNQICNLLACSVMAQPTAPLHTVQSRGITDLAPDHCLVLSYMCSIYSWWITRSTSGCKYIFLIYGWMNHFIIYYVFI
jgi:hypothetical protein